MCLTGKLPEGWCSPCPTPHPFSPPPWYLAKEQSEKALKKNITFGIGQVQAASKRQGMSCIWHATHVCEFVFAQVHMRESITLLHGQCYPPRRPMEVAQTIKDHHQSMMTCH